MSTQYKRRIQAFMLAERAEVESATMLAENAAHAFDHDEWLDDETHIVWDLANDIFNEVE